MTMSYKHNRSRRACKEGILRASTLMVRLVTRFILLAPKAP